MILNKIKEFDIFTAATGLLLRRLYGRKRKLPKVIRRLILKVPENFHLLGRFSFLTDHLAVFDQDKSNFSVIPINQDIQGSEDQALPLEILDRLIERSTVRAVLTRCVCRTNYDCRNYPEDFGCLFLGESALETPKGWQKKVTKEEAMAHARQGISHGLVPMVGKIRFDSDTLGIMDRGKLMTVCFCCECCCLSRHLARPPVPVVDRLQHPVEGIEITITDNCMGCGTCVETCYLNALEIRDNRAHRKDICRACGRCAARCPNQAVKISLANPDAVDQVVDRLLSIVAI